MLKISVFLWFCSVSFTCAVAQPATVGEARYGIQYIDKEASGGRLPSYVALSPHVGSVAERMEFSLVFESDASKFDYIDHDLKMGERELIATLAYFGYSSTIWQDWEKTYSEAPIGFLNDAEKVLVYSVKEADDWVITDESKMIGDYLCIKATKREMTKQGDKTVVKPFIAWFCPEIPVPFGPLNQGGLPGLILELQTDRVLFGLERIEFKPVVLEKKPDLEGVNEDDYLKRTREFIEQVRKGRN